MRDQGNRRPAPDLIRGVVIEHGPGGGVRGGEIVAEGTPETVAADAASVTGFYFKPLLERQAAAVVEAAPMKPRRKKAAA